MGGDWKTVKDEINSLDLRFKWMLIAAKGLFALRDNYSIC